MGAISSSYSALLGILTPHLLCTGILKFATGTFPIAGCQHPRRVDGGMAGALFTQAILASAGRLALHQLGTFGTLGFPVCVRWYWWKCGRSFARRLIVKHDLTYLAFMFIRVSSFSRRDLSAPTMARLAQTLHGLHRHSSLCRQQTADFWLRVLLLTTGRTRSGPDICLLVR
jgi:hypothetical protein